MASSSRLPPMAPSSRPPSNYDDTNNPNSQSERRPRSKRGRRVRSSSGSFDDSSSGVAPVGTMDPNSAPPRNYGSIPPRPRTSSKEFCPVSEISSIIGRSPTGGNNMGTRLPSPRGGPKRNHRRTMSDGRAPMPVLLPEGMYDKNHQPVAMPNPNYVSNHHRADSYGSQGSYPSQHMPPPADSYGGGSYHSQQMPPRGDSYGSQRSHHSQQMPQRADSYGSQSQRSHRSQRMPPRADSYGSQRSHHSQQMPPHMGVYMGGGGGGGEFAEQETFLAQHMAGGGGHGTPAQGYKSSGRPKTHMRQHSVNLFMNNVKGKEQPKACKDVWCAILFILQLVVISFVGFKFGPEALVATAEDLGPGEGGNDDAPLDTDAVDGFRVVLAYQNIIKMAYTCGAFAIIVSALALAFMMAMSRRLVYVALVLSIGVSFAWGTIGIGISPESFVPITGIIALMVTVGYTLVVWDRIPFASANLTTALTGVRENFGLVGAAFFFQLLALVCSIYYSFTFVGLHDAMRSGEFGDVSDGAMYAIFFLVLVSYYWTYQVLRQTVMVTVAGTIGSWWFGKQSALSETFLAATVYNFGSICYGSLFVGLVQFLRQITHGMRPNNEDSAMMCLVECSLLFQARIVSCIDNLADSFTPWAFTYMGLYRYGLKDAGHKANELFDQRGWTRIVTDDLISSVLALVSLVIGGLTGSFAVIVQDLDGHGLTNFGHPVLCSFTIGFLVGIVLSTVLFSIIESSVCAVIVCFAGSPVEFHRNHPKLSNEMRHAWKEVWPGSLAIENVGGVV